jgi:hypothetical protein
MSAPPRFRVNVRGRGLGGLEAHIGGCVRVSHDAAQKIQRRQSRVGGNGADGCIAEHRFLVWRAAPPTAAPLAWFGSSWHRQLFAPPIVQARWSSHRYFH